MGLTRCLVVVWVVAIKVVWVVAIKVVLLLALWDRRFRLSMTGSFACQARQQRARPSKAAPRRRAPIAALLPAPPEVVRQLASIRESRSFRPAAETPARAARRPGCRRLPGADRVLPSKPRSRTIRRPAPSSARRHLDHDSELERAQAVIRQCGHSPGVPRFHGRILSHIDASTYRGTVQVQVKVEP
jgi:hypothetical protein